MRKRYLPIFSILQLVPLKYSTSKKKKVEEEREEEREWEEEEETDDNKSLLGDAGKLCRFYSCFSYPG